MKSLFTTIFVLLFAATGSVLAQANNYKLTDDSKMIIEGTSTIHDWEADVQEINLDIKMDPTALKGDTTSSPVKSLSLSVPVEKIESGKGGMNKKIYGALKEDKHPNIMFNLTNSKLTSATDSSLQLNVTGTLNIAGVEKEVSFPVEGTIQDNGSYKFTGEYELNMKDYEVDPPSAVFGTIKSGEMVTINFDFIVAKA